MNRPYLYQTFKQLPTGGKGAVYLQVIHVLINEGEVVLYTLLNLDGKLNTAKVTPAEFSKLVENKVIEEWRP